MTCGGSAFVLLKDGLNSFIDVAMASVRRSVSLENHVPEAVAYMGAVARPRVTATHC